MSTEKNTQHEALSTDKVDYTKTCGIIMPISPIVRPKPEYSYDESTLATIRLATEGAIHDAELIPSPVWESNTSAQIASNIINNIFNYPCSVCVICGLNANAMIELGMAIAFGKKILVITDEFTPCPFDIKPHQYSIFPIGKGYKAVDDYKREVASKLRDMQDDKFQSFLSHYGRWTALDKIPENNTDLSAILNLLVSMKDDIRYWKNQDCITTTGPIMQDNEIFRFLEELLASLSQLETDLAEQPEYNPEEFRERYQKIADRINHLERIKPSLMNKGNKIINKYIEHIGVLYHQVAGYFNR